MPVPPRLTPAARVLIDAQRGVLATWQLERVGLSGKQVRTALRRDWQRLTPRSLLTTPGEPTAAQLRMSGALDAGPMAALTGCSALVESGWTGQDDGHVDVVLPRGHRSRRVAPPTWLRVHGTTDVTRSGGIPRRVTTARAALDAAVWARSPRERMFILASSVQQRLVTPTQLRRELGRRDRLAHCRELREVLDDLDGGVTTSTEADFLRECRRRRLPVPHMQVRRVAGGRRRCIDAEFRLPDGRVVMVEIDGVGHLDVAQWQADLQRQNELVAETAGALLLRVTGWQVRHDPEPFFSLLVRVVAPTV